MSITVGLDIGGSTTKIVGFSGGDLMNLSQVKASDPVASAYGGLGRFLEDNRLSLADIGLICVTGVGASYIEGRLFERPTYIAPEFQSVGLGGLYLAKKEEAIVVSMGTGTSFVAAHGDTIDHVIGSGVGGGTLLGLGSRMLNVRHFDDIAQLAESGNLKNIDLAIKDISRVEIPGLSPDTTASNFGKISDLATPSDLALGIVNLVFQSVGTSAVMAARSKKLDTIVFTGNLMRVKAGHRILALFAELYHVDIIIPQAAEYATAIGAALSKVGEDGRL
jgi:type II pantothenate kinase